MTQKFHASILNLSWDEWQIAQSPHIVPGKTSIRFDIPGHISQYVNHVSCFRHFDGPYKAGGIVQAPERPLIKFRATQNLRPSNGSGQT